MELRPEVQAFAELMETQLRKHDPTRGPAGWKTDDVGGLTQHLRMEIQEFWVELPIAIAKRNFANLAAEGADVANMLMMVLDVFGVLPAPTSPHSEAAEQLALLPPTPQAEQLALTALTGPEWTDE